MSKEQFRPRLSEKEYELIQSYRSNLSPKPFKASDSDVKTFSVSGCWHVPFHNKVLYDGFKRLLEDVQPDGFVLAGDFIDVGALSDYERGKISNTGVTLEEEYYEANIVLDELQEILPNNAELHFLWGNHCFDRDTELLSENGWVKIEDLSTDVKFASYNEEKDCIEYSYPTDVIKYEYNGDMHLYETSQINVCVTPKHRMYAKTKHKGSKFRFVESHKIIDKAYKFKTAIKSNITEDYPISDDEIRFAAWIHTDGSMYKTSDSFRYVIYQSKPEFVANIRTMLDSLHLDYAESVRVRDIKEVDGKKLKKSPLPNYEFRIKSGQISNLIKERKKFDDWVYKLSPRQFDIFLNTLVDGDGSRYKDHRRSMMVYGYREFLEQIQDLCFVNGITTSLYCYRGSQYKLNINFAGMENGFNAASVKNTSIVQYTGLVGCITTVNGTVICKRDNKISVQGNCNRYKRWKADVNNSKYGDILNPTRGMNLIERGFNVVDDYENGYVELGSLQVLHGLYHNIHVAKQHLDKLRRNCMFPHTHRTQYYREGDFAAWNIGFMGNKNAPCFGYANRAMREAWANAFAFVHVKGERFFVEMVDVVDDHFVYGGKYY